MQLQVLKPEIHNAYITEANIAYTGSITIDEHLMNAADIIKAEQAHVINHRNGSG